jgi:branched-subunit amino acid transport protein AzlD
LQIFAVPIVVGALSAIGLVAALVGDGWWDRLSWLSLALPVLLYLFFIVRRKYVGRIGAA